MYAYWIVTPVKVHKPDVIKATYSLHVLVATVVVSDLTSGCHLRPAMNVTE